MAAHSSLAGASESLPRPLIVALCAVAAAGAIALVVLIVRELTPHHAALKGATATTEDESSVAAPIVPTAAPAPPPKVTRAPAAAPAATQAAATPRARDDGLTRVRSLASIIHDPESWPSDGVFHDRIKGIDKYSYENFGPFRRGDLKRDSKNPDAWDMDGSNGPGRVTSVEALAPPGGTREAATIRDDKGNTIGTWYAIEAGPLAPAYATVMASGGTRVISRAYLESNRDSFPPPLTSLLDH